MRGQAWLKRVLIPFWTVDLLLFTVIVILCGIEMAGAEYLSKQDSEYVGDDLYRALVITIGILLAMALVSLIFDITAIVLFARHKLTPVTFLVFQCIKFVFWTYVFVSDIIGAVGGEVIGLGWIFSVLLFFSALGQLIYGSVIMHRKRKGLYARGYYAGVQGGAKGYQVPGHESPPRGSYAGYNPHGAAPNPFRDPSREPSPQPSSRIPLTTQQPATHSAFKPSGEADAYYNAEGGPQSYEMRGTSYRDN